MPNVNFKFDCIVVGAGHAGIEASIAASRLGLKTMLATLDIENIGLMPCNPAIGGPAKSNLVREIDALGGVMAELADATYLQLKTLNSSKDKPSINSPRPEVFNFPPSKHTFKSEPNCAHNLCNSSFVKGSPKILLIPYNMPAASVLPPAKPAAIGIFFSIKTFIS